MVSFDYCEFDGGSYPDKFAMENVNGNLLPVYVIKCKLWSPFSRNYIRSLIKFMPSYNIKNAALLINFHLQVATAVKNDFTLTANIIGVKTAVNQGRF